MAGRAGTRLARQLLYSPPNRTLKARSKLIRLLRSSAFCATIGGFRRQVCGEYTTAATADVCRFAPCRSLRALSPLPKCRHRRRTCCRSWACQSGHHYVRWIMCLHKRARTAWLTGRTPIACGGNRAHVETSEIDDLAPTAWSEGR